LRPLDREPSEIAADGNDQHNSRKNRGQDSFFSVLESHGFCATRTGDFTVQVCVRIAVSDNLSPVAKG
jgi:hypothetical protein